MLRVCGVLVGLALLGAPLAGGTPGGSAMPEFVDGHVLVGFKASTTTAERKAAVQATGASLESDLGAGIQLLDVPNGQVLDKVGQLRNRSEVAYAEPDYIVEAVATIPNDPSFGSLYGMTKINAPEAWDATTGSSSVVVGVVDTGVDWSHPDLSANIWSNPGGVGGCGAGTHGYNAIKNTCKPSDGNSHGTHVSGTIGAVGNNGIGVAGVNWTVKIMGLKFLNSHGSGTTSNAIKAINFAITAKQAGVNIRVLNNSWGGGGFSQALLDKINQAGANDILFVAAAGNASNNNDGNAFYPCNYNASNLVCVAATDSNDNLASFSNYGATTVDLAAPGVGILSTVPGGGYASYSGTSMATPHVTGSAALVLSQGYKSVSQLKSTLLSAVDPLGSLSGKVATGGRLDVCKAVTPCP